MKHLTLDDIKIPKPDFTTSKTKKGEAITEWLVEWVKYSLEYGIVNFGDLIPNKHELATFLNVSPATVQNSIRQVKNMGYFYSKQSVGTCIADFYSKDLKENDGLCHSSIAECKIKKIVLDEKTKINTPILSIAELSKRTDISQNTIRFSLIALEQKGYLEKIHLKGNKHSWIYKKEFTLSKEELTNGINDENITLTHQLIDKIQEYLEKTYKTGDKILPNQALSNMFDVSIKTVNDAMKILNSKKIILSRRGKYGTIYLGKEKNQKTSFVTQERRKLNNNQTFVYSWQKALTYLKKYIIENYSVGDKIAPIRELANILNVSPNTIRRALADLFNNEYLISKRGKLGGIYIIEMPQSQEEAYRWIALNPEAILLDK